MKYCLVILLYYIVLILFLKVNGSNIKIKKLINMYKASKNYVYIYANAGLGYRLMSFFGSIILSIYYESKPLRILFFILKISR